MAKMIIGKVVGDSAYDTAVKNGFIGTEEEWLASLQGETGFSPTITVAEETETEYVLEITTEDGSILTPNLKGQSGEGGDAVWGSITGNIVEQTDLQASLSAKQNTLTAGANVTITAEGVISASIEGGGGDATWGSIAGDITNQADLQASLATKQDELTSEQLANINATYAEVATSGSYNDLTDTPLIPSIDGLATTQQLEDGLETKQNVLTAGENITITDNVISSTGGEFIYTNAEPTVIEVGGIEVGTTFDNVTLTQLLGDMFYPEQFPLLTAPSSNFTDNVATTVEVGSTNNITFTTTFNRGTIVPAYGTNGFRSGPAIEYVYTGTGLTSIESSANSNVQNVTFTPTTAGTTSWTSRVRFGAGEQPVSSKDNDYSTPLAAGMTAVDTITITSVYAYYATTVTIGTMTKQTLSTSASYYEVDMIGESDTEKQTIDLFEKEVNRITVYNSLTREWDEQDLTSFARTETTHNSLAYNRYTHTGGKIGARQIRFYF